MIKDARGNKLTTDQEKNDRWKEHFQNVLNCPEPEERNTWIDEDEQLLMISTSEITTEEVKQAIGQLKNHRSPGEDLITGEMLKVLGDVGIEKFTSLLNTVWHRETVPLDWKRGIIVRIPKKRKSKRVLELERNHPAICAWQGAEQYNICQIEGRSPRCIE